MQSADETDKGVGVGIVFGLLTAAAAAYAFVSSGQFQTAIGFGAAMVLAALSVGAIQLWG
ncbi:MULTISPECIES: hypothetical protein [Halobacterium]|nr:MULTISPECIES: hypothetical protein [Halobacterium]AAG19240.1 hypothetical protein VNG_0767H [Halobacterium salinarum NRC-1]MCF2165336.1 hypothetical protein [Halobacterium salinarum]MCF2168836.1 hypothetical protein [Halobacterium salinarum]MCF2207955.1 hypothetical protein [Halobacterium salinarum]MCF2239147.1 hypothetical protein [Halobacterium salinarum]